MTLTVTVVQRQIQNTLTMLILTMCVFILSNPHIEFIPKSLIFFFPYQIFLVSTQWHPKGFCYLKAKSTGL